MLISFFSVSACRLFLTNCSYRNRFVRSCSSTAFRSAPSNVLCNSVPNLLLDEHTNNRSIAGFLQHGIVMCILHPSLVHHWPSDGCKMHITMPCCKNPAMDLLFVCSSSNKFGTELHKTLEGALRNAVLEQERTK